MLTKNNIKNAKKFCREDISKIENYDKAMSDKSDAVWICHHRLGIELNKSGEELQEMGLYFNRPASELFFVTTNEHTRLHNEQRWKSQENREKQSKAQRKRWESQEERNKESERKKKLWKSQEYRDKQSEIKKEYWSSQENRDKQSEKVKKLWESQEHREKISKKISKAKKGVPQKKYRWLTPDGEEKIMDINHAKRYHPDWILVS